MKKILLPADFTDATIKGAHYAADIARMSSHKAEIIVFHVNCNECENKGLDYLTEKVPELNEHPLSYKVKDGEDIVQSIVQTALEEQVDIVIMGTRGDSSKHLPYGSYTFGVIENYNGLVLGIPTESEIGNVKKILFASDFKSVEHATILKNLTKFARIYDAEVHILNVSDPNNPKVKPEDKELTEDTLEYFLETIKHTYHITENPDIEKGIDDYVQAKDISMIAMMPRKHSSMQEAVKGRLVKNIALNTRVPLLTFNDL